jgi:hypothetical protein
LVAGRVDGADRGGGTQLDVVVGVELLRVQIEAVAVGLAAQVGLGERRTLIRPLALLANQQKSAIEALGA